MKTRRKQIKGLGKYDMGGISQWQILDIGETSNGKLYTGELYVGE